MINKKKISKDKTSESLRNLSKLKGEAKRVARKQRKRNKKGTVIKKKVAE